MINLGRHSILGVYISAVDYEYTVHTIIESAKKNLSLAVTALAVHGVISGFYDKIQRRRLNGIDLVLPDGQPIRWGLKWVHGIDLSNRVYGPDLMLKVVEAAAREGLSVYFYGSTVEILQLLIQKLMYIFPNLIIADIEPSKFRKLSKTEKLDVVNRINNSKARIVFVGLGCPRQEVWVYEYREYLKMPLIAVGAAFALNAKVLPQAPRWMQNNGMEWLYRLIKEPKRLWKRYILLNPVYLILVLLETLRIIRVSALTPNNVEFEESYG